MKVLPNYYLSYARIRAGRQAPINIYIGRVCSPRIDAIISHATLPGGFFVVSCAIIEGRLREEQVATTANLSLISAWAIGSWGLLLASLILTNPPMIGPLGVTLWFILLLSALATTLTLGAYSLKRFLGLESTPTNRLKVAWRQGGLLGAYLTLLLAMSSLGQLALRDAVLLAAIIVCTELLIRFRRGISHE